MNFDLTIMAIHSLMKKEVLPFRHLYFKLMK